MGGKPRRPAGELAPFRSASGRGVVLPVRLSDDENAVLIAAARRDDRPTSSYMRTSALRAAEGRHAMIAVDIRRELDRLVGASTPKPGEEATVAEAMGYLELSLFDLRGAPR